MKSTVLFIALVLCLVNFVLSQGDQYVPHPLDQYNVKQPPKIQPIQPAYYPYMPIYIPQWKAPEIPKFPEPPKYHVPEPPKYHVPEVPKYTIPEPPKVPPAPYQWNNYHHGVPNYYAKPFNADEFNKYMPDWLNAKPLQHQQPKDFPKFPQYPHHQPAQPSPYAPQDWNDFFKKQYPWTAQFNAFPWGTQKTEFGEKPLKSVGSISESDYNVSGDESESI